MTRELTAPTNARGCDESRGESVAITFYQYDPQQRWFYDMFEAALRSRAERGQREEDRLREEVAHLRSLLPKSLRHVATIGEMADA